VSGHAREPVVSAGELEVRVADSRDEHADESESLPRARAGDFAHARAAGLEDEGLHDEILAGVGYASGVVEQIDLFAAPAAKPDPTRRRLEQERTECAEIASRLPAGVFFGTSSWSFPDWEGIVYPDRSSTADLARDGLSEYVRHPLLTTVGIDRSYYAPIPRADLERYAAQLPAGFPCCAKAPEAVTSAALGPRAGPESGRKNPDFFNPRIFEDEILAVFADCFLEHAGPFILQVPPAPSHAARTPEAFAAELERFLGALPRRFRYAVELREERLLTRSYRDALAAHGAAHVYNFAGSMPMPADQERVVPLRTADFAVVRLLLPPGRFYGERRDELWPFNRISSPQPEMRRQVADLARRALDLGRTVTVLVNNKAEGCAPLTIRALAGMLAGEPGEREGLPGL
jgi:uncharacterized protein YecE (DUF72 family)